MEQVEKNSSNIIYFHFDTKESQLSVEAFGQLVKSLNTVTDNVSKFFYSKQAKCNIYILPPEEGSFKSKFCIFVTGAVVSAGLGNFGDGILEGITGHDYKYYGKQTGALIKDVTVGIFSKPASELDAILPDNGDLDQSIKAKTDFYLSIINDDNVLSLGFTDEDKSLIQKSQFCYYIAPDKMRDISNIQEYAKLTIIKPITVRSTQVWTLKDHSKTKSDDYKILDENFKELVWSGENPLKESEAPDEILAKIEYVREMKNGVVTTVQTNITDVYQFNNRVIKDLPSDFKLNEPTKIENNNGQISIFDILTNNEETKNV